MKPISSFRAICRDYGLNLYQTHTLQSLIAQRKGVLRPYWIYVPYDFAKRLYSELITNEWAVPDETEIDGVVYESELTDNEMGILVQLELEASGSFSSHR